MSFNIAARLSFSAPGVKSQLKSLSKGFNTMKKGSMNVGRGLRDTAELARGAALAAAPIGAGIGLAINEAAQFEKSLSAVQSILRVNDKEMQTLANTTKELGLTTKFTAIEANRGAQLFAQAGFTMQETIAGLPGVLNLAAAGELQVADAANVVASNVRAFGLEATEATRVADILAETSALTNTDVTGLGEALKLSAAKAKGLGFTLSQTASAIGVISNVGVKGTLAGTALRNALQKLSKPSKETSKLFGDLGVTITDSSGALLPFSEIFTRLNQTISKSPKMLEKARRAAEVFGIRGEVAFGAFRDQASKAFLVTGENVERLRAGLRNSNSTMKETDIQIGKTIPKLVALDFLIDQSAGSAERMAAIRLDNFLGQVTLLSSAISGFAIQVASLPLGDFKNLTEEITNQIIDLTKAFRFATGDIDSFGAEMKKIGGQSTFEDNPMNEIRNSIMGTTAELKNMSTETSKLSLGDFDKQLNTIEHRLTDGRLEMIEFAKGFLEGFKEAKVVIKETAVEIKEFFKGLTGNQELTTKELGRLVGKFITLAAVATPIILGLSAVMFILLPIFIGLAGGVRLVIGVLQILFGVARAVFSGIFVLLGFTKNMFTLLGPSVATLTTKLGDLGRLVIDKVGAAFRFLATKAKGAFGIIGRAILWVGNFLLRTVLIGGLKLLWGAALLILKNIALMFGFLISPIGLVVAAIVGLGVLLYVFQDEIKAAASAAGQWMVSVFVNTVVPAIDTAIAWIGDQWDGLMKTLSDLTGFFSFVVARIYTWIGTKLSELATWMGQIWTTVLNKTSAIFESMKNKIFQKFTQIKENFKSGVAFFTEGGAGIWQGLLDSFSFVKDKLFSFFDNLIQTLKTKIGSLGSAVTESVSGFSLGGAASSIGNALKSLNPFSSNDEGTAAPKPTGGGNEISSFSPTSIPDNIRNIDRSQRSIASSVTDRIRNTAPRSTEIGNPVKPSDVDNNNTASNRPIIIKSELKLDGQLVARSISKAHLENAERQGTASNKVFKRSLVERAPSMAG